MPSKILLTESESTDLKHPEEIDEILTEFKDKEIKWHIFPGMYRRVRFNYRWYNAKEKWVYMLNGVTLKWTNETYNPLSFNTTNLITRTGKKEHHYLDWYQSNFTEYGSNGIKDITDQYIPLTNKSGKISWYLSERSNDG